MGARTHRSDTLEGLDRLRSTLHAAESLLDEVAGDRLLVRLIEAFRAMPISDREVIVGVIEREVKARLLSRATARTTGQAARPNPNARLYIRTHGHEATRADLEEEEMMLATIRALRVMHLLLVPEIYAEWRAATLAAFLQVDAETRGVAEKLLNDMLALLGEANRAPSSGEEKTGAG
jgi:hypothetical protein